MPGWLDNDRELLKKAQQGNSSAFGDLYERHASAIFRFLYAHLDSQLDAEDLTCEVFLKAWQSLPNYQERGVPFLAFLFRIARNTLVDHYRQSSRTEVEMPDELDGWMPDANPGPAETISSQMEHQEILQILGRLRQDYQSVLILRFISDLSPEETAQVMNRSAGAIRVLQHRALGELRKQLKDSK